MSVFEIKNLTYSVNNKKKFNKLNLSINKGSHITILGPNGSGKSVLVDLINQNNKSIRMTGTYAVIYSNPDIQVVGRTVQEQLMFHMQINNYSDRKMNNRLKKLQNNFEIDSILNEDPFHLSEGMRQLIVILSYLVLDIDILILDSAFNLLDIKHKEQLFNYMKKMKKITIISFSSNPEDSLWGKEVAILNKKILLKGSLKTVFDSDKVFLQNGLTLPFTANLSLKLQYYDIIDKIILDMDKLVDAIWK